MLVDVLIVAMTSPGKAQPVEDGEDLVAVRRQADRLHHAGPVMPVTEGCPVEIVVVTVCVLRLTTEIPPAGPGVGDIEIAGRSSTAKPTGSGRRDTVVGVVEQPVVTSSRCRSWR